MTNVCTSDGGKTFTPMSGRVHVDNHHIGFDPTDSLHIWSGNDGGLYESFDGGVTWRHFQISATQFYAITLDNTLPFYNIYGGTQDNGSIGTPSRSAHPNGIRASEFMTVGGGDGFQARADLVDNTVLYASSQNGAIRRIDKRTGESKAIAPPRSWGDSQRTRTAFEMPYIISPHNHNRLYVLANVLFRSENRGDKYTAVGGDLTRALDRDTFTVMGRKWGPDAVNKHLYTNDLSVGTALDESPLREGLLYVGTDDGLIQVSENGGRTWRAMDSFPGVPDLTFVSKVLASRLDTNVVYAAFNNMLRGDFNPYLLKSTDRGRTWTSIRGNLPDRDQVWTLAEDHVNRNILFAGTEHGRVRDARRRADVAAAASRTPIDRGARHSDPASRRTISCSARLDAASTSWTTIRRSARWPRGQPRARRAHLCRRVRRECISRRRSSARAFGPRPPAPTTTASTSSSSSAPTRCAPSRPRSPFPAARATPRTTTSSRPPCARPRRRRASTRLVSRSSPSCPRSSSRRRSSSWRRCSAGGRSPHPIGVRDPAEVHDVLSVPVSHLVDPATRFSVTHPSGYVGPGFDLDHLLLWGFTAGLISSVLELGGLASRGTPTSCDRCPSATSGEALVSGSVLLDVALVLLLLAYALLGLPAGAHPECLLARRLLRLRHVRGVAAARGARPLAGRRRQRPHPGARAPPRRRRLRLARPVPRRPRSGLGSGSASARRRCAASTRCSVRSS